MQKVLFTSEVQDYSQYLDDMMVDYISRKLTKSFEGFADFDLMAFDWYDVDTGDASVSQILIYIDREDLFFFCEDQRSFDECSAAFVENDSNEKALYLFFVNLLKGDMQRLDSLETAITNEEALALKSSREDYLDNIYDYRRELLRLKRYYEQLTNILDNLSANDNDLFSDDGVRHFMILHGRVSRFCSGVMSLRDYVTQMREACQSQIDLEQNKLMRVFTVIASIFLPLTLIAGWYGMNFKYMPELSWRFGYPAVIALSVLICVLLIIWFKHKKWF